MFRSARSTAARAGRRRRTVRSSAVPFPTAPRAPAAAGLRWTVREKKTSEGDGAAVWSGAGGFGDVSYRSIQMIG